MGLLTTLLGMKFNYERERADADRAAKEQTFQTLKTLVDNPTTQISVRDAASKLMIQYGTGELFGKQPKGKVGKGQSGSGVPGQGDGGGNWLAHGLLSALAGAGRQAGSIFGVGMGQPSSGTLAGAQRVQQELGQAAAQPAVTQLPSTSGDTSKGQPSQIQHLSIGPAGMLKTQSQIDAEKDQAVMRQAALDDRLKLRQDALIGHQEAQIAREESQKTYHEIMDREIAKGTDPIRASEIAYQIAYKEKVEPKPAKPATDVQITGPDGKVFWGRETEDGKLTKLTGQVLGPEYQRYVKPEPSEEKGTLQQQAEAHRILDAPPGTYSKSDVEAANDIIKNFALGEQSKRTSIEVKLAGVPGSSGAVPPPATPTQTPMQRYTPKQKVLVDSALSYLTGIITSPGFGQQGRQQINEGIRLIKDATGLSEEEIQARAERRKADKQAYDKLNLVTSSYKAFSNALARHSIILTNLRPSLPDTDVTKMNEWLQTGAREFNVPGLSKAAAQYGLALAAVRNEYARVIAGGTASVAQTPPEALKMAGNLISPGFTSGNTRAMVAQMNTEATQGAGGREDQLNALLKSISTPLLPELYGNTYQGIETVPRPVDIGAAGGAPSARRNATRTATGPNGQKMGLIDGQWVPIK